MDRRLPLVFEAFGDFKLPLYIYLTVPMVWMFGLTVWGVKMVSILAGLGFVWLIYLIGKELSGKVSVGLWSAGLMAITPWAIQLSRQGLESHLALFWLGLGMYLLLKAKRQKKPWMFVLAGVSMGLTFWSYVAYRLLIVLLVPLLVWWIGVRERGQWMRFGLALFATILPLLGTMFSGSGLARARQISLFADPGIVSGVVDKRGYCYLINERLTPVCKLFFNKGTEVGVKLAGNYVSFFSPEYLFVRGDKNLYLNNPDFGEFLWVFAPLLLIGFSQLKRFSGKNRVLIIGLLLLAPVPAALSGTAQMVRSSAMLLPFGLLLGLGGSTLFEWLDAKPRKWLQFPLVMLLLIFFGWWMVSYVLIYPTKHDAAAYQLPSEVASYLSSHESQFDEGMFFDQKFSDAHIYTAFYRAIDPAWYVENVRRPEPDGLGFSHPSKLGDYYFNETSFERVYCEYDKNNFVYIGFDPVLVQAPDGKRVGYTGREYTNFSGVHPQARIQTGKSFAEFLKAHSLDKDMYCRR